MLLLRWPAKHGRKEVVGWKRNRAPRWRRKPSMEAVPCREKFIGDKISINPIIPFIAEVR